MKQTLIVFVVLLTALRAWTFPQITVHNVGTNNCNFIVWYQSNGDPGPAATSSVLAPGGTSIFTDGRCGSSADGDVINMRYGLSGHMTNQYFGIHTFQNETCSVAVEYGPVTIQTTAPTNCTDHVSIPNPNAFDCGYQLYINGAASGIVFVAGGQTARLSFPNPNCNGNIYTYQQIIGGSPTLDPTVPGAQQGGGFVFSPSGQYLGGTLGDLKNAGGSVTSPGGGGTDLPPEIAQPTTNTPPTYVNTPLGSSSNGPINFTNSGGSFASTNAANNGTIQQAANAQYTVTVQGDQSIVDAIKEMDAANRRGHAGTSNMVGNGNTTLGSISNTLAGISNLLANQTNTLDLSNLINVLTNTPDTNSQVAKADANADAIAIQTDLQSKGDALATISSPSIPSMSPMTITIGSGAMAVTADINPLSASSLFPQVASICPWVRRLSQWGMTFWFLIWLVGEVNGAIRQVALSTQAHSADAAPVVGEVEGALTAGLIMAAIHVLVTADLAYVTSGLVSAFLAHPFDGSGPEAVQRGVAMLDAVFDIGMCLSYAAQRVSIPSYITKFYIRCNNVIRFLGL